MRYFRGFLNDVDVSAPVKITLNAQSVSSLAAAGVGNSDSASSSNSKQGSLAAQVGSIKPNPNFSSTIG